MTKTTTYDLDCNHFHFNMFDPALPLFKNCTYFSSCLIVLKVEINSLALSVIALLFDRSFVISLELLLFALFLVSWVKHCKMSFFILSVNSWWRFRSLIVILFIFFIVPTCSNICYRCLWHFSAYLISSWFVSMLRKYLTSTRS